MLPIHLLFSCVHLFVCLLNYYQLLLITIIIFLFVCLFLESGEILGSGIVCCFNCWTLLRLQARAVGLLSHSLHSWCVGVVAQQCQLAGDSGKRQNIWLLVLLLWLCCCCCCCCCYCSVLLLLLLSSSLLLLLLLLCCCCCCCCCRPRPRPRPRCRAAEKGICWVNFTL